MAEIEETVPTNSHITASTDDEWKMDEATEILSITPAGREELRRLREERAAQTNGRPLSSSSSFTSSPANWPAPPSADAFLGLAGDIVRTIEPYSESDPAAILAQVLCAFGNLTGRAPHVRVEADEHAARPYIALIGDSSRGRKGTSWGHVRRLMTSADESFDDRVEAGLSSGEGLIDRVRDPRSVTGEGGEERIVDAGVLDKRLLVVETELPSYVPRLGQLKLPPEF